MNIVESFFINKKQHIDIVASEDKFNYYYEPIPQLTKFDEVSVIFKDEKQEVVIGFEMIDIVLEDFRDACLRILNGEARLPDFLSVGTVGYQYNITTKSEGFSDLYSPVFAWSGKLMPTFLYEKNGKIYFEISPLYPWLFENPKGDESFVSFEEFMKSYKSTIVEISDRSIIRKWLLQCENIFNTIEINHAQRLKNDALK